MKISEEVGLAAAVSVVFVSVGNVTFYCGVDVPQSAKLAKLRDATFLTAAAIVMLADSIILKSMKRARWNGCRMMDRSGLIFAVGLSSGLQSGVTM